MNFFLKIVLSKVLMKHRTGAVFSNMFWLLDRFNKM